MDLFYAAFALLIGHEGGFTADPRDPGNWTGGAVGVGKCLGTKFGISAASFPTLAIAALTLDQARAIYFVSYWQAAGCHRLPPALAFLVFDSAVNNGVGRAIRWMQAAVGTVQDGLFGTATVAALARAVTRPAGLDGVCAEFAAQRLVFMAGLPTWRTFGLGWARRLSLLPFQAVRLPPPTPLALAA